jgi:signal peptidase I
MKARNLRILIFILAPLTIVGLCIAVLFALGFPPKFYVVVSESMIPTLRTGDAILISSDDETCSSFNCLKVGDIIVFEPNSRPKDSQPGEIIVHRVQAIGLDADNQRVLRTKGDANPNSIETVDYPITENQYVGKVISIIPYLGVILMYFDLLARVFIQPVLYIVIGAVGATVLLLEYQKRLNLKSNSRKRRSKWNNIFRGDSN